jgi:SAM-dependent methyltransferase
MIKKIKKAIVALRKINALEKKLNLMNNELRLLVPDIIPITESIKQKINYFEIKQGFENKINYSISKNDLMFRYACYHIGNIPEAYYGYLQTGLNPRNIINKIVNSVYGSPDKIDSILDFAAGYGRVTRFLCADFSPKQIWASEIKSKALDFISEQFKCNTIQSSFIPEEFKTENRFDVIYVGSLFSHLPEDLFNRWLRVLYELLSEKGILIISTHDISLINKGNDNSFVFIEDSEDQMFAEIDDHIEDVGKYGAAYVGKNKIGEIFDSVGISKDQFYRFKRVLSNVQDVYVIQKYKLEFKNLPDLTSFP